LNSGWILNRFGPFPVRQELRLFTLLTYFLRELETKVAE
jgi:hypothetical protein